VSWGIGVGPVALATWVMDRIEVITSVERRRRWKAPKRARLVAEMGELGDVVTEIARCVGVEASLFVLLCVGSLQSPRERIEIPKIEPDATQVSGLCGWCHAL
jgi:hypothetical protein